MASAYERQLDLNAPGIVMVAFGRSRALVAMCVAKEGDNRQEGSSPNQSP